MVPTKDSVDHIQALDQERPKEMMEVSTKILLGVPPGKSL
jgi:hypothetical protein